MVRWFVSQVRVARSEYMSGSFGWSSGNRWMSSWLFTRFPNLGKRVKSCSSNPSMEKPAAMSWLITVLIGWVVTGDPWIGVQVGGVEMVTKMVLYYFHERAWFRYGKLGREKNEA